jgi:F-type H+-transporting ATPase subunit delta
MIVDEAARRYADALFEAAGDPTRATRMSEELGEIVAALGESEALRRVMEHPLLAPEVKERVLVRLFGERLEAELRRLLVALFARGRAGDIDALAEALRDRIDAALGRRRAVVRSVAPLSSEQLQSLRAALEQRLGGSVEIETETDASLIGGLEIRVGGRVLDLSVARRLRDLRRRLTDPAGAPSPPPAAAL